MTTLDARRARRKRRSQSREPRLVVAFACERPLSRPLAVSLADVDLAVLGRGAEETVERGAARLTVTIPDAWMSSTHARMVRALGKFILEDAGSRNGTRVNGQPITRHTLEDGDLLELGSTFFIFRWDAAGDMEADGPERPQALRTLVPELGERLERTAQLAQANVAILIQGQSGVGKEVLARAIHTMSLRSGSFVGVNCGAIAGTLIESELFGYKRGAFSGAVEDRAGLVRSADRGTLFLDEIVDLSAGAQAALLRVLQEREVRPVGSTQTVPVDIRLLSATHQDVDALVERGSFRKDLLARIAGFRVTLPPLRERREDMGIIVAALLRRIAGRDAAAVRVDPEAARALFAYDWPLNVRELENCLSAATVFASGSVIEPEHLPEEVRGIRPRRTTPPSGAGALSEDQLRHRREMTELLREHRGNVSAIARATGKDRKQIQRWIKRYLLDPERFR
jgi:transcriptional regulator with PAS, ATPase and Fis domain